MIYNLIAGIADAHGKSLSILYGAGGPRLAPLYDLLATVAYPELSPKLAMPIVRRRVRAIGRAVQRLAPDTVETLAVLGLDAGALRGFAGLVQERAERCAASLAG